MTISNKVKESIKTQGRKKNWLASQLDMSRPKLDRKLNDNYWSTIELQKLESLGLLSE